jgi:hypothetical protein
MYGRALVMWSCILGLASLNGALRDFGLTPALGDTIGRAISTVLLCVLILFVAWLSIGWIGPATGFDAVGVGGLWVFLTLAFEFLVGHYVFGKPWPMLLADYDVSQGRIWILALLVTFCAPFLAARWRELIKT